MKLTDVFIKRPVLAIVVNLIILVAGIQAGARHYITKPFQFDDLRKKVRKVLYGK